MSLVDRLVGGDDKIPAHQFYASLVEFSVGQIGKPEIINYFNLSQDEADDLDWLIAKHAASTDQTAFRDRIQNIIMLAQTGFPGYTTSPEVVAVINGIV